MNSNRHIDPEDLALFALQFLTPDQNQQVREHLEGCSLCRNELAQIQGDLAVVASTAEMHSPPALARERLLQQVAREPKQKPASQPPLRRERCLHRAELRLLKRERSSAFALRLHAVLRCHHLHRRSRTHPTQPCPPGPSVGWLGRRRRSRGHGRAKRSPARQPAR